MGIFLFAADIARAENRATLDFESSVRSRFVWRGEMWTDDPVFWQTVVFRWGGFRSWISSMSISPISTATAMN